jgi:hypothetical protein
VRVTLSYFVEPNPGPRQTNDRYRYASCGLRFDVRRATESEPEFRARTNREAREQGEQQVSGSADSNEWDLGFNLARRWPRRLASRSPLQQLDVDPNLVEL